MFYDDFGQRPICTLRVRAEQYGESLDEAPVLVVNLR